MKTMTPTMRSTFSSVSSVINALQACMGLARTSQCARSQRHLSHMTSVDGSTSTTRVASCSTTLLSRKRGRREISVIRELDVWEVVDRPLGEVVFGTRWVDINEGDENKPFYRSRLVVLEYKRQADWSFLQPLPPLEALRSLLICGIVEELANEVGQPVAWSEPVVFNAD